MCEIHLPAVPESEETPSGVGLGWGDAKVFCAIEKHACVNRQAITNVLRGEVWPDMLTLIDLEGALGVVLWPTEHVHWKIPAPGTPAGAEQSASSDKDRRSER
ncbi:hypothetical protein [Streptacidiphilus sp. PAMC 29251]